MAKKKRRVRIKQKAQVRRKGEGDNIKKAPAKVYPENGAHIKVRLRKKEWLTHL